MSYPGQWLCFRRTFNLVIDYEKRLETLTESEIYNIENILTPYLIACTWHIQ